MQSFRSPGNPSLFRNLVAIQGDCVDCGQNLYPEIFGNPSELCQDCLESAIDPQFTGLCQDCKESENPVSGIAQSEWAQIRSNRSAIRLNCIRVAQNPESSCNQSGLQISRSRLREDCDNPKELALGIAGHREDCRGSPSNCLGLPSSLGSNLTDSR